jgi:hypothetical protein
MRTGWRRTLLGITLTIGAVLVAASPAAAAPPANDDFDDAVALTAVPFTVTADTTEATRAADDPNCIGDDEATVWYDLTLAATTEIVLDTFGSDFDTTLSAWTGARGGLTLVACNDDAGSLQSRISFVAEAGVTYHLMVGSFPTTPGGNLVLNGQVPPPPLQLGLTLNANGTVTSSGAAVIGGTVTCSRPVDVEVVGTLRQQNGSKVTVGSYRARVSCTVSTAWTATVLGETGTYRRGTAAGVAAITFLDQVREEIVRARATATVRLR